MATTFIGAADLASYLGVAESPAITTIVGLVNGLIDEKWLSPITPTPASVQALAWAVAVRAGGNPKGLTSWTRKWDDVSRTERMEAAQRLGVYITDDEIAELNGIARGRVVRSVRVKPC